MKKILILGISGMAGHVVYTYLNELNKYELLGTTNSNSFGNNSVKLDIFNIAELDDLIHNFKPDFIINCIGVLISSSKKTPENAVLANSYLPHHLARLSYDNNFKLIHISTDCVFSGKEGRYTEKSFKNATDLYGISKSLGEIDDQRNVTIRTSIIGPEIKSIGEGLFHWFMFQEKEINGYKRNFWSGVTTLELAYFIEWILNTELTGLVHLTNNESISKFDLLTLISSVFNKEILISNDKEYVCDKSFINTNNLVSYKVSTYREMLEKMKKFMENHSQLYTQYKIS
ncbi:SDR family oxidoreductase [Flavobacterium sp. LHD-80]|uniref:dTDP-4-dehydrorhamnose reductase family protein n=1 Tax=Flavobacterium sp. LHD-80 TaxID=3071411 RepID=UPI0027E0B391|nr:SDR family oxidoreductase [Flavobacterium sp. LHD-80]MDQ6472048.1 SDR family oxidoreductase [Flavobacterium sp. LHD-80]